LYSRLERVIIAYGSGNLWRLERAVVQLRQLNFSTAYIQLSDGTSAHRLEDLFVHPNFDDELRNDIAVVVVK